MTLSIQGFSNLAQTAYNQLPSAPVVGLTSIAVGVFTNQPQARKFGIALTLGGFAWRAISSVLHKNPQPVVPSQVIVQEPESAEPQLVQKDSKSVVWQLQAKAVAEQVGKLVSEGEPKEGHRQKLHGELIEVYFRLSEVLEQFVQLEKSEEDIANQPQRSAAADREEIVLLKDAVVEQNALVQEAFPQYEYSDFPQKNFLMMAAGFPQSAPVLDRGVPPATLEVVPVSQSQNPRSPPSAVKTVNLSAVVQANAYPYGHR